MIESVVMYKISIIIPVFNVKDTLEMTFNSILNQTFGFENIEVIFIDDCSNAIIDRYVEEYENVKLISHRQNKSHEENSINDAIKQSSADYLMFLDSCELLTNACEVLYGEIKDSDFDIVSGNYEDDDLSEIAIRDISEEPDLLNSPDVSTKIIKKDLISNNNLSFQADIPQQNLLFMQKCLLNANGIKHIDVHIANHNRSPIIPDKKLLIGQLKTYSQMHDLLKETPDFEKYSMIHLDNWIMQFSISQLTSAEKYEVLNVAQSMFNAHKKCKDIPVQDNLKEFYRNVYKKKYFNAIKYCERISLTVPQANDALYRNIKGKDIVICFLGYDYEIGGLAKAVFDRANLFDNNGYSVKIINIDEMKNFDAIRDNFYNLGFLNRSLDVINIYDYYCKKNTLDENVKTKDSDNSSGVYVIKKESIANQSEVIQYYDCNELDDCSKENLVKKELYICGHLSNVKLFENGKNASEMYLTPDGFTYLEIKNKKVTLFDRFEGYEIHFKNVGEFYDYFITKFCLNLDEKPFLICDCSSKFPSIKNIDSSIAYKIGNAHSNPYSNKPHTYGCKLRNISAIRENKHLDKVVVLTHAAKSDFDKEFKNPDKFTVIPNFINEGTEYYENRHIPDNKVISIFCRISPEKNLTHLLKAFKIVLDKHEDAVLKIYGRAVKPYEIDEKEKLAELIDEMGISDSVHFMGHVDNAYEEMNRSLVTVLVSDIEGLPMVIMESMYNHTPMVCYDLNYGPRDVITDGVDGFIVEQQNIDAFGEKLIHVLDNPEMIYDMGFRAHEKIVNEFSSGSVLKKWEELFVELYKEDLENKFKKEDDYNSLKKDNAKLKKKIKKQKSLNSEMTSSNSWKLTKPLRSFAGLFRKLKNKIS